MKKAIYTIFDQVTQTYWYPFYAVNDQEAKRSISSAVNTPDQNDLYMHPSDFSLYAIGEFSAEPQPDIPLISAFSPIKLVCHCQTLISKPSIEKGSE